MDLKWNPGRLSHPASAAVQVTDLSWRGILNPSPLIKDDGELLLDEYLSPRKLKVLTGVDDLQRVKALEMQVDTRENSLGNFGAYLPNLRELKLNNSLLVSVRDLGTTLSHLRVLWMACCGLSDLDGISSCSSLKELYVAYNNISDLSQLTWLEYLEVLDLEGNNIEDINQMQYLGLCCKLSRLTVEGNLICRKPNAESAEEPEYNYRAQVKKLIPHLEYLDEIPASQTALLPPQKMHEDWLIIKEPTKDGGVAGDISWLGPYLGEVARQSGCGPRPPMTSRPGTAQRSASAVRPGNARLLSCGCPLPDPTVSNELFRKDDSSDLTYGLSQVICGNPTKALRARRQKLGPFAVSPLKLCGLRTENPYGSGRGDLHQEDKLSELRVGREQHKRCLQPGQQEEDAQALKETLGDEEESEDCSLTDCCEEELRKTCGEDLTGRISLDSSCHSCVSQSSSERRPISLIIFVPSARLSLVPLCRAASQQVNPILVQGLIQGHPGAPASFSSGSTFSLIFLLLLMYVKKPFLLSLTSLARFNSKRALAFLVASLHDLTTFLYSSQVASSFFHSLFEVFEEAKVSSPEVQGCNSTFYPATSMQDHWMGSSGSSQTQEGAVFSNLNHCLIPSPPKGPSPASVTGVAARPWKMRNHRIRCLKISCKEEDRQWTQWCQSKAHQETSAQPLGKNLTLLNQHSMPAASIPQGQPPGSTGWQRPVSRPAAAVGSSSIRPTTTEHPPGEINHHQPTVCSSTKASEGFGLMNTAWPLTARARLQSLPGRPTASVASQSKGRRS
ncbi:leucine-rich repeat-containing protein 56 [Rhynochetos jubatus]